MSTNSLNYKKYQKLVDGKNINPQTLLATDYLNHFNEIHMLLGMISDMPDCLEDILEWETLTYPEHFQHSVFQDKEVAIEAYEFSPKKYKNPFEKCVAKIDDLLLTAISKAEIAIKNDKMVKVNIIVGDYSPKMEKLIEECSAIINGIEVTAQQDVIDDYFDENETSAIDQNSIDDLFD